MEILRFHQQRHPGQSDPCKCIWRVALANAFFPQNKTSTRCRDSSRRKLEASNDVSRICMGDKIHPGKFLFVDSGWDQLLLIIMWPVERNPVQNAMSCDLTLLRAS